jgi:geranylgeranyl pyrophosphate synthase
VTSATSALRPAPRGQLALVADRLHEILITGGTFDPVYHHILAAPGKRVRAGLVLACARRLPSTAALPLGDAVDMACAMEMVHESGQRHPREKKKR